MTRPVRYDELTPAQRAAFDARYGAPRAPVDIPCGACKGTYRVGRHCPVAGCPHRPNVTPPTVNGVTLGPESPLRGTKPRRSRRGHEDAAQMAVIAWADGVGRERYPDLRWLYHPANGGARDPATAGKMKAMGVRQGVPDLILPVRRGDYVGLAVELKVWKGSETAPDPAHPTLYRTTPSAEQLDWHRHLADEGWRVTVEWGAADAIAALVAYLNLTPPTN